MNTTKNFKVEPLINNIYQVIPINGALANSVVYQGTLADCHAYIMLKEEEYMK